MRSVCRFEKLCGIQPLQLLGSGQCAPHSGVSAPPPRGQGTEACPTRSRHGAASRVAKAASDDSRWGVPSPRVVCVDDLAALELSNCGLPCLRIVNHRVCYARGAVVERVTAIGNVHLHCL